MTAPLAVVVTTTLATASALVLVPALAGLSRRRGLVRVNYRGQEVPCSLGLSIPVAVTVGLLGGWFLTGAQPTAGELAALLVAYGSSLAGFFDDVAGDQVKGLKGHGGELLQLRLSGGGFKIIVIGMLSLAAVAALRTSPAAVLLGAAVVALSANVVNLLDLRPGRALKGWALALILVFLSTPADIPGFLFPFLGAAAGYAPWDMSARGMLGDAGANALGAVLGLSLAAYLGVPALVALLAGLFMFHLLAELFSLTRIIERFWLLRVLDRLGRP